MDDKQIQDIADRVIEALHNLEPAAPSVFSNLAALTPIAALVAAIVAAIVGWRNLKQQQKALRVTVRSDARNLRQKREADARSEWWKRTQWALEAAASDDPRMYAYGTGMLDLLAQSELAGPKDKELLDAVWEGTDTEMQDEDIEQLIKDASEQGDLTYEEMLSLISYDEKLAQRFERAKEAAKDLSYQDLANMLRRSQEAPQREPEAEPVDDDTTVRDNESTKEDADG